MSAPLHGASPVAPGGPAGRPQVWQAALMAAACAVLAAWSCSGFLGEPPEGPESQSGRYALVFLVSTALGAGPLMLVAFRLWPRRERQAWPRTALAGWLALAGTVLVPVGWGGIVWSINGPPPRTLKLLLVSAVWVVGLILLFAAVELLVVGGARRIAERRRPT